MKRHHYFTYYMTSVLILRIGVPPKPIYSPYTYLTIYFGGSFIAMCCAAIFWKVMDKIEDWRRKE